MRERGTPLPTNDIWVAASAAAHGAGVLTFDDHFRAIERVGTLVLPIAGPGEQFTAATDRSA